MILAVVSKKGGVGKTTTAVNLAAALADRGHRVLLVDLDSQASASLSLGVPRSDLGPSVADALLSDVPMIDVIRSTRTPGLDLVTASVDLLSAETELGVFRHSGRQLRRALEPLERGYDYILLDSPPSVSLLPTNALTACHAFLMPVVPQFLAVTGVQSLLRYAERLQHREADPRRTHLLGLVLTMVDYRTRATRLHVERLRRHYGAQVCGIEIRINVRLAEAPESGQTIFDYDPTATGAEAYRLLAEEVEMRADKIRCGGTATP